MLNIITNLFYLVAVLFICYELRWVYSPVIMASQVKRFDELSCENQGKAYQATSEEYQNHLQAKAWLFPLTIWLFLGLFTFQWGFFLSLILFNVALIAPITRASKYNRVFVVTHWLGSVVNFLFGIFVIVNHYHLNLTLHEVLKSYSLTY